LQTAITALAVDLAGAAPDDVVLAPPHTVLKTSSGKVRRAASRELYERGHLTAPTRPAWRQILHLAWTGMTPQLRRAARGAGAMLYALYAWMLFWILAPPVWLAVAALPRPAWHWPSFAPRQKYCSCHPACPCMCRISTNCRAGRMSLRPTTRVIWIASFLPRCCPENSVSSPSASLPRVLSRACFCGIRSGIRGAFRAGTGVEDARVVARAARRGKTLVFFPEGTFTRTPGLLPFHMGAFVAAAEAGVPLVPVTIRGTRSILRSDQWFPRRGTVAVTIGTPVPPEGADWAAAIRLRDTARAEILRHCGEPDLADRPPPA